MSEWRRGQLRLCDEGGVQYCEPGWTVARFDDAPLQVLRRYVFFCTPWHAGVYYLVRGTDCEVIDCASSSCLPAKNDETRP